MSETEREPALFGAFCLFFDFLGSSEIARYGPNEKIHQFIDILEALSAIQSEESWEGEAQADGSYKIKVTPEISTFSDNVVASWSMRDVDQGDAEKQLVTLNVTIVCQEACRILGSIAEHALRIGLIIRGGLAYGELFHRKGRAVFGEAMVDAYRLESKDAKMPRVLVADNVIEMITTERPEDLPHLKRDTDGRWYVNYYRQMIDSGVSSGEKFQEGAVRWRRYHLDTIEHEIAELKRLNRPKAAEHIEKWEWFKARFSEAYDRYQ